MNLVQLFKAIPYKSLLLGPTILFWVGAFMNKVTMAVNNGLMPVLVPGGCPIDDNGKVVLVLDSTHSCMTSISHLKWLSDWINWHDVIASLGDCVIDVSNFLLLPFLFVAIALIIRDSKPTRIGS